MRTGEVEANLVRLNDSFRLPCIPDLIARKLSGAEKSVLEDTDMEFHRSEFERLIGVLEAASQESSLPNAPECKPELDDFLVRARMKYGAAS
jgi:hypothetical protein